MIRSVLIAAAGLMLVFEPTTAVAGAEPVSECGTVITAPGKYRLTQDLLLCPETGITISSSDVVLNLKGRRITCDEVDNPDGLVHAGVAIIGDFVGVRVKNGTVTGCNVGVLLLLASDSKVSDMTMDANGWWWPSARSRRSSRSIPPRP